MTLQWDSQKFDPQHSLTISLWGYREKSDVYPSLTHLVELAGGIANSGEHELNQNDIPNIDLSRYDFTFGFISINMTGEEFTNTIWSKPIPLAWFMRKYWEREYGVDEWNKRFCQDWFNIEKEADRFATTVFRCPCTIAQSDLDRGRFAPDLQCNVIDKNCESLHHGAQHCVTSGRPS